jgi:hypothetical protein
VAFVDTRTDAACQLCDEPSLVGMMGPWEAGLCVLIMLLVKDGFYFTGMNQIDLQILMYTFNIKFSLN